MVPESGVGRQVCSVAADPVVRVRARDRVHGHAGGGCSACVASVHATTQRMIQGVCQR